MPLVSACILPHPPLAHPMVGRGEEQKISATLKAAEKVSEEFKSANPETLVIISPHTAYYADYIHISPGDRAAGSFRQFGAPQARYEVEYDSEFRETLIELAHDANIPAGVEGNVHQELDHGVLIPLHFLGDAFNPKTCKVVRIGSSALPRNILYKFGKLIAKATQKLDKRVSIVASGDLSHKLNDESPYGFNPAGPKFDDAFGEVITSGDLDNFLQLNSNMCTQAAECGLSGFIMLAGALSSVTYTTKLRSLEGPFGVGYGVASMHITSQTKDDTKKDTHQNMMDIEKETSNELVRLAAQTVRMWVTNRTLPEVPTLSQDYPAQAGAFVSIHTKAGELRGCIGTIGPTKSSLAKEVIDNATKAATEDPRFPPITPDELPTLTLSVDVLGKATPATMDELDAKTYGVIVTKGFKRGLLLPDLEGVDTPEQQVAIALRKAGIPADANFQLERFKVDRYE